MESQSSGQSWFDQLGLAADKPKSSTTRDRDAGEQRDGERANVRRVATIALLVLVLLGPIMTFGGMNLSDEGTVERQFGYLMILGLAVYAVWPVSTRSSLIAVPVPVIVAFAWCWLSLTWAIDPDSSLRRLVLTTSVAWTTFLLVRHSTWRSVTDVIRWCLVGSIAISYVVVWLDPQTGMHMMLDSSVPTALIGNWRGFLGHKNFAGAVCAMCILFFVFDAKRFPAALRIGVIVMTAYFLYRSQSKTSAGMLGLAIAGGVMFETLNRRLRSFLIPIATVLGSLVWLGISAYGDLIQTNVLNPTSFTGRGQIWSVLLRYAGDHMMRGAGFGSFWNIGGHSPVFAYGQGYVTSISVGHSGYIDTLITVGLPGVLLMIFATMVWPFWKLFSRTDLPPERGALLAAMLMFCIGHNITESGLFERDAIVSTLLFFTVALAQYGGVGAPRVPSGGSGDDLLAMMRTRRKQTIATADL